MGVVNAARDIDGTAHDFPDEMIEDFTDGTRQSEDWWEATVDPPLRSNRHSLTMRGGTDRVKYFTSFGTVSQGSLLRGDDKTKLRQYNARANLDVQVSNRLNVGFDMSYRQKHNESPQGSNAGEFNYVASTSPLKEAYIDGIYDYPSEGWSHLNPVARILSPGYRKYD